MISPLVFHRVKFCWFSQSAIVVASWVWSRALSSRAHEGWWRLKSPVMIVGCWERILFLARRRFSIQSSPLGESL